MGEYFGIIGMVIGVPLFATATAIGKEFIDHRLRMADLPTDTAEYYADDSLVDPYEHHETFSHRLFRTTSEFFCKLFRIKKKEQNVENLAEEKSQEEKEEQKEL